MSKIVFNQVDTTPGATPSGATQIYTKTDGLLYGKSAAEPEMQFTVLSGGQVTVAGAVSAQGNVYGNAEFMTMPPGTVIQVVESSPNLAGVGSTSTSSSFIHMLS